MQEVTRFCEENFKTRAIKEEYKPEKMLISKRTLFLKQLKRNWSLTRGDTISSK